MSSESSSGSLGDPAMSPWVHIKVSSAAASPDIPRGRYLENWAYCSRCDKYYSGYTHQCKEALTGTSTTPPLTAPDSEPYDPFIWGTVTDNDDKLPCEAYGHCWCQETWVNGKPHKKCCNCGHQLVKP